MLTGASPPVVAPPLKKLRGGNTPLDTRVDHAVNRRRAELLKLQQQKTAQSSVISQARNQLHRNSNNTTTTNNKPALPSARSIARVRHSNLYPSVTPQPPTQPTPVARCLDAAFQQDTAKTTGAAPRPPPPRSKSAPPARPPPPRRPLPVVAANGTRAGTTPRAPPRSAPSSPEQKEPVDSAPPVGPPVPSTSSTSTTATTDSSLTQGTTPFYKSSQQSVGFGGHAVIPSSSQYDANTPYNAKQKAFAGVTPFNKQQPPPPQVGFGETDQVIPPSTTVNEPTTPFPAKKQEKAGVTPFYKPPQVGFGGDSVIPSDAVPHEDALTTPPAAANDSETTTVDTPLATNTPFGYQPTKATPFASKSTSAVDDHTVANTPYAETTAAADDDGAKDQKTPLFFNPAKAGATPFPGTARPTEQQESSSTTKDLLRSVAASMDDDDKDVTSSSNHSHTNGPPLDLRFQREVTRLEHEKADALQKVASLQTQRRSEPAVSFLPTSPITPRATTTSTRKFVPTPMPKRKVPPPQDLLVQATKQSVHEYDSPTATFIVRRPYGLATERELWFSTAGLPNQVYREQASATDPTSLEVVAQIAADDSMLVLSDRDTVRHCRDGVWHEYDHQRALGTVLYIDQHANEQEYELDDVYQATKAVRDHYVTAIVNTVSVLESTATTTTKQQMVNGTATKKSPTKDTGTDTNDLPGQPAAAAKPVAKKKKPKKADPPPEPEDGILSTFIGMLTKFVARLLWTIFVETPLRIVQTAVVLVCAFLIVATIRLYLAHDNGAAEMLQAGVDVRLYNRPGLV